MQVKEIAILKNSAPEGFMVGDVVMVVEAKLVLDSIVYRIKNNRFRFAEVDESQIESLGFRIGSKVKVKHGAHNLMIDSIGAIEAASEYADNKENPWMVKVQGVWLLSPEFEVVEF